MKYQKTALAAALLAMATTTQAGGLLTNTNQNIAFNRNFARVGAIGIDGVYFNPAGVAFLDQGFHLSLNFQNVYQTREITSTFSVPALANTPYEYPFKLNGGNTTDGSKFYQGKASVPILPSFQVAYNKDKWSFQAGFGLTGGGGKAAFNDILLMPTTKEYDLSVLKYGRKEQYPVNAQEFRDMVPYKSKYSHKNEKAEPGYYQVYLEDPKVNVELTAAQRYAVHRYTFEKGAEQSVLLNLGFAINWDSPTKTSFSKSDKKLDANNNDNIITGYRYSTGWAENQKVFFAIQFSKPIKNITYQKHKDDVTSGQIFFDNTDEKLEVKVAVSSVSEENALDNLELYNAPNFDKTKSLAQQQWEKTLSSIVVETPVDSLKTIFYTALYHAQVAPVTFSDKNGQFRLQNDEIAKTEGTAYSTLSLWDTFRAEHPLLYDN